MLANLALIKSQLRLDPTDTSEDTLLTSYANAAEGYILNFIDAEEIPTTGTSPAEVPADIIQAYLLLVSGFYENRESLGDVQLYKNPMVEGILWPYRGKLGV